MATTKITSPDLFDLGSLNTALQLPSGTTAERPTSPSTGEWRYNTTTNLVEFWDGGAWRDLQSEDIPPVPSENFNTVTYSGNSGTQAITGVGFQPDFVWIKCRSTAHSHFVADSTRGATKYIMPNETTAELTRTDQIQSFDTDGFTLAGNGDVNGSGKTYVAWCWKANEGTTSSNTDGTITSTVQANTKAGFSVVQYTGNGTAGATIGHGLSAAPEMIIVKALEATANSSWAVYHTGTGNTKVLVLNTSSATDTNVGYWNNTSPTASTFTLGTFSVVNENAKDYIAYCFNSVAGYSSFGSYTGNGSITGPLVNTGFEPAMIILKEYDGVDNWAIVDNKRSTTNPRQNWLRPNLSNAEFNNGVDSIIFLSNGFQIGGGSSASGFLNENGKNYIYIAFAADPSTAPVLADSFGISGYVGNASTKIVNNSGFSPSLVWQKNRSAGNSQNWNDAVRGPGNFIFSNNTDSETALTTFDSFNSNGFTVSGTDQYINGINNAYVAWQWKGNTNPTINTDGTIQSVVSANQAAGFSIVSFNKTTNSSTASTFGHGLGVAPEMIILKRTDGVEDWYVYNTTLGNAARIQLNSSDAQTTGTNVWGQTDPTSTVFTVESFNPGNAIAYCFKSTSGFSKIGTYTGTGATGNTVAVGFQPDFVMVKASSTAEPWFLLDSVRNPINPRDNRLMADSTAAEDTGSVHTIDFNATSFTLNGTVGNGTNGSGQTYIYMAYKMNPPALSIPTGEMAFLTVAGGGGGGGKTSSGNTRGGGGGGGGLKTSYGTLSGGGASAESNITLAAGTYTITVGAGGGKSTGSGTGISGGDSSIAGPSLTTITSAGGGGGGDYLVQGAAGGSGGGYGGAGGTGTTTCAGGAGTASQGFNGGGVNGGSGVDAGGGGGAGECGGYGEFRQAYGGVGGSGLMVTITSNAKYYAGGGGGGSDSNGLDPRLGGVGGGGYGASGPVGGVGNVSQPGVVNTGGGGGGEGSNGTPGDGGSGIVVLRLNTSDYSGTTTGSPTITTDGDYTVLEYTGSGTYVHS